MSGKNETHPLWQGNSEARLFEHLKVSKYKAEVRQYFERIYDSLSSKNLVDRHFDNAFSNQVPQRWWELFVGNWLLCQPSLTGLSAHSEGPDFSFDLCRKKCWIECTVPWPKDDDLKIDSLTPRKGGIVRSDPYILAITSAVKEKITQLGTLAKSSDYRVIALNLGTGIDVEHAESDDPPLLFQALLGVGPTAHMIPITDGMAIPEEIREVPTFKETVRKQNGTPIGVRGFLDGSFSEVSGILYSIHRYVDCPNPQTTDLLLLHNPTAANPLPRGSLALVKEYFVENDQLVLLSKPEHGGGVLNE
jgi:hypothetical protein